MQLKSIHSYYHECRENDTILNRMLENLKGKIKVIKVVVFYNTSSVK